MITLQLRCCLFASKQRLLFESPALFEGVNIIRMGVNIVRMHKDDNPRSFYAFGNVAAGGIGSGGGGGTYSVLTYAQSLLLTQEAMGQIPTAFSVKKLGDRITALENAPGGGVTSFNGRTGAVTLQQTDVNPFLPSSFPNPYALTFGSKTYNGASAVSIVANDINAILGYTPYNASNPAGYITGITKAMVDAVISYQAPISDLSTIRTQAGEGHTAYGWGNHANAGYATESWVVANYQPTIPANTYHPYGGSYNVNLHVGNTLDFTPTAASDGSRQFSIDNWGALSFKTSNVGGWASGYYWRNNAGDTVLASIGALGDVGVLNYYFFGTDYDQTILRVYPDGRVGIGTNLVPSQKLHVAGNILATGQVTAGTASDIRLKDNVRVIADASRVLMSIGGVEFDWNAEATRNCSTLKGHDVGCIAQEVEVVIPSAVSPIFGTYKRVDYNKITPYLVEGWKSHEKRIQELENELRMLKSQKI